MYNEKSKFKWEKTLEKGIESCIIGCNFNSSFLTRKFQKKGFDDEKMLKVNENKGGI
ncbi:MAG TPA: hypothetical protein VK426_05675 [Methanobacterium sp.]|nr:hypothetical protein [Methanobacterium sp.]